MITVYCTCGHPIYDHTSIPAEPEQPYHTGPCHRAACMCQRFMLDRSRTRYETATHRTHVRDAQIRSN